LVLEPIAESLDALRQLSSTGERDLVEEVAQRAAEIVDVVPDCVALSITLLDDDLTFTFVSTSEAGRVVDAAQYVDGGPCVDAVETGEQIDVEDLMDEDRWQVAAQAAAAHGIMSSLSLPLRHDGDIIGSINMYGSTIGAFNDAAETLAQLFGAAVQEVVANFDTSMRSRERSRTTPRRLRMQTTIDQAIGILAIRRTIPTTRAARDLAGAAERAGIDEATLAKVIVDSVNAD
jgi:GAF domain-containing protein